VVCIYVYLYTRYIWLAAAAHDTYLLAGGACVYVCVYSCTYV
jgi:hypothetical protein